MTIARQVALPSIDRQVSRRQPLAPGPAVRAVAGALRVSGGERRPLASASMEAHPLAWVVAGMRLRMPSGAAPRVGGSSGEEAYIVEGRDTLWGIGERFRGSVDALMRVTGLSAARLLLVGQRLVLP